MLTVKRFPLVAADDINCWDNIITNRAVFFEKLQRGFEQFWGNEKQKACIPRHSLTEFTKDVHTIDLGSLKNRLLSERADLYHSIANGARKKCVTAHLCCSFIQKFCCGS